MADATAGASSPLNGNAVAAFRERLRGTLLTASDEGYEQARRVWNGNIDRHPALIARCAGTADVIEAVAFARENQLPVAVRGGGHNAAGHATCEGGLVIDLSPMKGVWIDPVHRTARVEPGVTWGEFDHEAQAFGLATPGGTVSNTGVAGLTLGGGMGTLSGQYGLSADNLLSVDIVTADGQHRTVNENENADLFWALRGAGANFGVVTSFEFQLHPVGPTVLGGMVIHPMAQAREVLSFCAEFGAKLPDEAFILGALVTTPDGMPAAAMYLSHNGPMDEAERVLAPARSFGSPLADLVQPMPYVVRQRILDEGMAEHGVQRYWKSGFARELSPEIIDILVDAAQSSPTPMCAAVTYPIHGATTRKPEDATAYALREFLWDVNVIAQWTDDADSDRCKEWVRGASGKIEPLTTGTTYINHLAGDDRPERIRASYGQNYERLVAVKSKYDPDNFFHLNSNIRPTG